MLETTNAIIHHQQVIADIKTKLKNSKENPHEQGEIYFDFYNSYPFDPKIIEINGVSISLTLLHQTGKRLADIRGADLLYEIENEKYAIIQYKKAHNGRVACDTTQLDELLKSCPDVCYYKKKRLNLNVPIRMNGFCGCYYRTSNNGTVKYVHACEAASLFKNQKTIAIENFASGLSKQVFEEMFASCRIGALTKINPSNHYIQEALNQDHLILHVTQHGKW